MSLNLQKVVFRVIRKKLQNCNRNTYRSHDVLIMWPGGTGFLEHNVAGTTRKTQGIASSNLRWVIQKFGILDSHLLEIPRTGLLPRLRGSHNTSMLPSISNNDGECSCCKGSKPVKIKNIHR